MTAGTDRPGIRVEADTDTHVAVVTVDRPPVNAVDPGLMAAIRDTFRELDERRDIHAVVLTGAGSRAFCAGIDLNRRADPLGPGESPPIDSGKLWRDAKASVLHCAVPVIGAINGAAIGAGVGLASSCDILIAAEDARFGVTEIKVGALGGGSAMLRMVGPYKMRRLFYTGDLVNASELYRLGAVEAVVPQGQLLHTALELAREIATRSPVGLRLAKESLNRMELMISPWDAAYRLEQDYSSRLSKFEDSKEAAAAFRERREPVWRWR